MKKQTEKKIEDIVVELMKEKRSLEELGVGINVIRRIKEFGYNVKTDIDASGVRYWIKDVADVESQILISPRSSKVEVLTWAEVSDTHAGSIYFDKKGLQWFLKKAWEDGIRHVHHSGDFVDGVKVYGGQHNWLKYWRQMDQVNELAEVLGAFGFDYYAIEGNHDMSWTKQGSPRVGKLLQDILGEKFVFIPGKTEKVVRGDLVIGGVMKRLAHPWSSSSRGTYAMTYPAQTYLRNVFQTNMDFEIRNKKYKMQLLQYGHLHYEIEFSTFGVHVTHPLCFQKGNDFTEGKGLGGRTGGRITRMTVQDGEILDYDSKVLYVPERL